MSSHPRRTSISIPSCDYQLSLSSLLRECLELNYHPITFYKLFKEYRHRLNTDEEFDITEFYRSIIPLNDSNSILKLKYLNEIVIKNSDESIDNFNELNSLFRKNLINFRIQDQIIILIYFINLETFPSNTLILNSFINYINLIISKKVRSKKLNLLLIKFLKLKFIKLLNVNDIQINKNLNNYLNFIQRVLDDQNLFKLLSNIIQSIKFKNNFNELSSSSSNVTNELISTNGVNYKKSNNNLNIIEKNAKLLRLKKILWLSFQMTVKFNNFNKIETFIKSFKSLINLSSMSITMANNTICYELILTTFECLSLNYDKSNYKIWLNFLYNKLPSLIPFLKINQISLINILKNFFKDYKKKINENIKIKFLKKLILNNLIKLNNYNDIIKDFNYEHKEILQIDKYEFNLKFNETNPEFNSIEEIDIPNYINKLNLNLNFDNQITFKKLVNMNLLKFIKENEISKLKRLLISLLINDSIYYFIMLENNPYEILKLLIEYLDKINSNKKNFNFKVKEGGEEYGNDNNLLFNDNNDDMLIDDDDDLNGNSNKNNEINLQDYYSDFSFILIFIKLTIYRFKIDLIKLNNILNLKDYFNLNYLIGNIQFNSNSFKDFKMIQDLSSVINNNMNNWIISLFDSTGNDSDGGISDELIKSSNIKEILIIMPIIIEESIKSYKLNFIDFESLKNGLEYFNQSFLIGSIIGIIKFLINHLWLDLKEEEFKFILKILNELCQSHSVIRNKYDDNNDNATSTLSSSSNNNNNASNYIDDDDMDADDLINNKNAMNDFLSEQEEESNNLENKLIHNAIIEIIGEDLYKALKKYDKYEETKQLIEKCQLNRFDNQYVNDFNVSEFKGLINFMQNDNLNNNKRQYNKFEIFKEFKIFNLENFDNSSIVDLIVNKMINNFNELNEDSIKYNIVNNSNNISNGGNSVESEDELNECTIIEYYSNLLILIMLYYNNNNKYELLNKLANINSAINENHDLNSINNVNIRSEYDNDKYIFNRKRSDKLFIINGVGSDLVDLDDEDDENDNESSNGSGNGSSNIDLQNGGDDNFNNENIGTDSELHRGSVSLFESNGDGFNIPEDIEEGMDITFSKIETNDNDMNINNIGDNNNGNIGLNSSSIALSSFNGKTNGSNSNNIVDIILNNLKIIISFDGDKSILLNDGRDKNTNGNGNTNGNIDNTNKTLNGDSNTEFTKEVKVKLLVEKLVLKIINNLNNFY